MMAAARILIWLPVRLERRSRISIMRFPLGACSIFSGRRAYTRPMREATLPPERTEAHRDAGRICGSRVPRGRRVRNHLLPDQGVRARLVRADRGLGLG